MLAFAMSLDLVPYPTTLPYLLTNVYLYLHPTTATAITTTSPAHASHSYDQFHVPHCTYTNQIELHSRNVEATTPIRQKSKSKVVFYNPPYAGSTRARRKGKD